MHPSVFRDLMQAYLDKRMTVNEFETVYVEAFRAEKEGVWVERLYWILQNIFTGLDAYSEDCTPEEEDAWNITEPTLRKEVAEAVEKLDEFLLEPKGSYYLSAEELVNMRPTEFARL